MKRKEKEKGRGTKEEDPERKTNTDEKLYRHGRENSLSLYKFMQIDREKERKRKEGIERKLKLIQTSISREVGSGSVENMSEAIHPRDDCEKIRARWKISEYIEKKEI